MSFYTAVSFTRPQKPPRLTGEKLADFLLQFFRFELASEGPFRVIKLRFGDSIDDDVRPAITNEDLGDGISRVISTPWDYENEYASHNELLSILSAKRQPISRAEICLGTTTPALDQHLTGTDTATAQQNLFLDSWTFTAGPVESYDLTSTDRVAVGWLGLVLHGNGHQYPWKWPQMVAQLESHPAIKQAMELSRSTWPVPSIKPDAATIAKRMQMGSLWGYPDSLDCPANWFWTIAESG